MSSVKKVLLIILMVLSLITSGCGGGGNTKNTSNQVDLTNYVPKSGTLDLRYGELGAFEKDLTVYDNESVRDIAKLSDGGTVTLISYATGEFMLVKMNQTGNLDTTFAGNGILYSTSLKIFMINARSLYVLPDDTIFIAGTDITGRIEVISLNKNGAVNTSYASAGVLKTNVTASTLIKAIHFNGAEYTLLISASGILGVSDTTELPLSTYANGWFLPTQTSVVTSAASPSDGAVILAGYDVQTIDNKIAQHVMLAKVVNGSLDPSFGNSGVALLNPTRYPEPNRARAENLMIAGDGSIYIVGQEFFIGTYNSPLLIKLHPNGKYDESFNNIPGLPFPDNNTGGVAPSIQPTDSKKYASVACAVGMQSDGKIVIAGGISTTPDSRDFNGHGMCTSSDRYSTGTAFISRFNPDGTMDSTVLNEKNIIEIPKANMITSLAISNDNSIIGAGRNNITGISTIPSIFKVTP